MLFGWFTLKSSLKSVLDGDTERVERIQKRYFYAYVAMTATIYLLIFYLVCRGIYLFGKPPEAPCWLDYLVFLTLLTFHIIIIALYIYVYISLEAILQEIEKLQGLESSVVSKNKESINEDV